LNLTQPDLTYGKTTELSGAVMTATLDAVASEKSKPEPTPEERAAEELVRRA